MPMLHNLLRQISNQAINQAVVFLKILLCLSHSFALLIPPRSRDPISFTAYFADLRLEAQTTTTTTITTTTSFPEDSNLSRSLDAWTKTQAVTRTQRWMTNGQFEHSAVKLVS